MTPASSLFSGAVPLLLFLAKATFLGHLIDEVGVPPLRSLFRTAGRWSDWNQIFRHPLFQRVSGPAEEPQGQVECRDGPGSEDE